MEARFPARDSKNELFDDPSEGAWGGAGEPTRYSVSTEQDLEVFKRTHKSSREEAHAKEAIDVAGMFPMVGPSNPYNKRFYHFATDSERMRLTSNNEIHGCDYWCRDHRGQNK